MALSIALQAESIVTAEILSGIMLTITLFQPTPETMNALCVLHQDELVPGLILGDRYDNGEPHTRMDPRDFAFVAMSAYDEHKQHTQVVVLRIL